MSQSRHVCLSLGNCKQMRKFSISCRALTKFERPNAAFEFVENTVILV
jgi:hypothetical protein